MSVTTANTGLSGGKYLSLAKAQATRIGTITTTGSPITGTFSYQTTNYRSYTYTGTGTLLVSADTLARVLVLGGGGSGGGSGGTGGNTTGGGGGGAAAYVDSTVWLEANITYTVVIGAGGAAVTNTSGNIGNSSYIYTGAINLRHSYGGGGGAGNNNSYWSQPPSASPYSPTANGGGGSPGPWASAGGACNGGSGNGMSGGTSYLPSGSGSIASSLISYGNGGGGGGAGSAAVNDPTFGYTRGGNGATWINGTTYAGGGAGGWGSSTTAVPGGTGGGGSSVYNVSPAGSGTANTGSGGGGGWSSGQTTGAGGSGIVIIAIPR